MIVFIVKNLLSSSVEKNNNFGKLLSLAYIVFEITQICKSLNNYTDRKARNVLSRRTKYKGFVYPANYSRKELENNINMINDTMEKIIDLAIKKNDIDITDSVCPIGTSIKVLYKLLTGNIKMEFLQETISLEDVIKAFLFNSENHPVIRPQYAWKIDNDFILAFSKLGELITKLNEININPPIDKSGIEKDSNILCNSEDDRFDLHLWP